MDGLDPSILVPPPDWSLALGVIGRVLVLVAAGLFAASAIAWLRFPKSRAGKLSFDLACASVIGVFIVLAVLFAAQRYEFQYVFGHTDSKSALPYQIAGIWSGQEGSFLLWGTASSIFALLTVRKTAHYRRWYTIAFAFFLGGIASILAFESPFNLTMFEGQVVVPIEGVGLAPSLQNYWVVIHPPTIFMGFGSLTCLFALAFAALATKDYDGWAPIVRPWAIVSVVLVGLGLCMGGFWAYETLGWGGFWMWDPVENVSFVPWCFAAALVHGVIVQVTQKRWQMTNLLLAALPFLVFLYGTFMTRSGVLSDTSVHSFAEMDRSALKLLLALMGGTMIGFIGLWAVRALQARKDRVAEQPNSLVRREGFYKLGVASLLAMGVATMLGMSVPLIMALQGKQARIVEEPLYHQVLSWIFFPLMLLMAVTPFVTWKGMRTADLLSRAYTVFCVTVGVTGMVLVATVLTPFKDKIELNSTVDLFGGLKVNSMAWIVVLFALCTFVIVGNAWRISELYKRSKLGVAPFMAHIGVAVLMAGLIVSRGFEKKEQSIVMMDHPGRLLNYEVRYAGMTLEETNRDNEIRLDFYDPEKAGAKLFTATPGLYYLKHDDGHEDTMVWPHIERGAFMDTYVSLGIPQKSAAQDVTLAVGESAQVGGMTLTYQEMVREGEMGETGASVGARVMVSDGTTSSELVPKISFGEQGVSDSKPSPLSENMELALVSLNAEDRSATLRVQLTTPIYPIEVFHKPMTILVWLGTALMTVSGIASAIYRKTSVLVEEEEPAPIAPSRQRRTGIPANEIGGTS